MDYKQIMQAIENTRRFARDTYSHTGAAIAVSTYTYVLDHLAQEIDKCHRAELKEIHDAAVVDAIDAEDRAVLMRVRLIDDGTIDTVLELDGVRVRIHNTSEYRAVGGFLDLDRLIEDHRFELIASWRTWKESQQTVDAHRSNNWHQK